MEGFTNKKETQPLLEREMQYNEDVADSLSLITNHYSFIPAPCPILESYELYKSMNLEGVVASYVSTALQPPVSLYLVGYSKSYGTKYLTRYFHQTYLGLVSLQRTYPRTCILKETLQTRINDWFTKQDVDFENQKEFSKLFHVVSNDKTKLEYLLKDRPLDQLAEFPEMEAEIYGNSCLFKVSNDLASEHQVTMLLEMASKIYKVLY